MPNIINAIYKYRPNGTWYSRKLNEITRIVIHHSAYPLDGSSPENRLKTIGGWHVSGNKWPGISYHFYIHQNGEIYQLNKLDDLTWTDSKNRNSLAILVDGYFHEPKNDKPTEEQLKSLQELLDYLCNECPEFPASTKDVYGHRDVTPTACPGDHLYPIVMNYKAGERIFNTNQTIIQANTMTYEQQFEADKHILNRVVNKQGFDKDGRLTGEYATLHQAVSNNDLKTILEYGMSKNEEVKNLKKQVEELKNRPPEKVEVVKEVIKEVPIEVIKHVETVKNEKWSFHKFFVGLSKQGWFTVALGSVFTALVTFVVGQVPELEPFQNEILGFLLITFGVSGGSQAIQNVNKSN